MTFLSSMSSPVHTAALAAVFLLFASTAHAAAVAPIPVTVCFAIDGNFPQVMYLPQYYTYRYIQPQVKIVGFVESPASTPRGVTLSLARNGTDCYVYLGPATSAVALAVNAVMNCVWMANTVTATEFSDRINYPLFNRAIPRVDVNEVAITKLMAKFKWTNLNILCTDNAYGQAATAAVSTLIAAGGGTAAPKCIGQFATYADAEAVVKTALASKTRVLMIVSNTGESAYVNGVQAINALDVTRKLIVVFAEPVCTKADPLWKTVPGSFCAVFTPLESYNAYYSAFMTRDTTAERAVVAAIPGLQYSAASANVFGGYNAFAVDGARLVYAALDQYVALYGKLPPTPAAAVAWIRNRTLPDGFMGPIEIPNGDRVAPAYMRIYNSLPGNVSVAIGNFTSDGNLTLTPSVFVLGQQRALDQVPPAIDVAPPGEAQQPYWVIGVVLGVLLIILLPALYILYQKQLLAVRPLDSSAPFAVMFVGVKNVDEVRDAGDANSAAAFAQVANDLRAAVKASGCYEARRVDESTVMVVAKKVDNALRCASQLMTSMDRVDWHSVMHYQNEMVQLAQRRLERTATGGSRSQSRASRRHSRGAATASTARVRALERSLERSLDKSQHSSLISTGSAPLLHIGIHFGFGMIDHDESLNTVSYVGKAVTRAAEVADVAVAGQILASREANEAADAETATEGATWAAVGAFENFAAFLAVAPDTAMFVPKALSEESLLAMRAAAKRAIDSADANGGVAAGGTIAAALQRADAGLSHRRIGALMIKVPGLRDITDAAKVAELIDEVTTIAAVQRGEVQAMLNGTILITVNAGSPAAQPVARAALIALEVMQYLDAQQLTGTAGIAGGVSMVGRPTQGAAFATFGYAVELAEVAQRMAEKHGLKVCAIDTNSYDDLAARLHVATIDVVPTPQSRDGMSRLLAIVGERDSTGGEWLYSVGTSNAGMAANEHVWQQFLQLRAPSDDAVKLIRDEIVGEVELWHRLLKISLAQLEENSALLASAAETQNARAALAAALMRRA